MTMPETSVDEDCQPGARNSKVRVADKMISTPPTGHIVAFEQSDESDLSTFVPTRTNARHYLRTSKQMSRFAPCAFTICCAPLCHDEEGRANTETGQTSACGFRGATLEACG